MVFGFKLIQHLFVECEYRILEFSLSLFGSCIYGTNSLPFQWFNVVTSNIGSFHATVLISIVTQAQIRRIPLPPECFYHSSEAARHINNTLQDPNTACSEENIIAIASLVMFEVDREV